MTQKQESAALDAEISEAGERINRTLDSLMADLQQLKIDFNRKLRQEQKQADHDSRSDDAE